VIAETVEHAKGPGPVFFEARRDEHVQMVISELFNQLGRCRRGICIVSVHENIDIGINNITHVTDDVALASMRRMHDFCASVARDFSRLVGRGIIENINRRFGQRSREVPDDPTDGELLIQAWDNDAYSRLMIGVVQCP
jgi:hypothetical protein